MDTFQEGIVVKSTGNEYEVRTAGGSMLRCKLRGQFRMKGIKSTNPIAVGDHVRFQAEDRVITEIEPRKNYITRKSIKLSKISHIIAANIDQLVLVISMCKPVTPLGFIDRFLTAAESFRIKCCLAFNKTDLYGPQETERMKQLQELYEKIGYPCLRLSATKGEGLEVLKSLMQDKISLMGGQSGVGKSTLINAISPQLHLKTGEISNRY